MNLFGSNHLEGCLNPYYFQNIIGGIVGAKKAILSPVINIVKGIKGGILGVAGGILQAKGNLLASKGAALSNLAASIKGSGGGGIDIGFPSSGGGNGGGGGCGGKLL